MPCCVLIAFLLGQLFLAGDWVAEKLGVTWTARPVYSAAEWRPGSSGIPSRTGSRGAAALRWLRTPGGRVSVIGLLLLLEAACLALVVHRMTQAHRLEQILAASVGWCGNLVSSP